MFIMNGVIAIDISKKLPCHMNLDLVEPKLHEIAPVSTKGTIVKYSTEANVA